MKMKYIVAVMALAVVAVVGGTLGAEGPSRLAACADCPPPGDAPRLPALGGGGGQRTLEHPGEVVSLLQLDDGTCESGLGAGTLVTAFQQFTVPSQCLGSGLEIVAVTGRMNSGSAQSFAFAQAGPAPPFGGLVPTPAAFPPFGACPATAVTSVALPASSNVVTGTTTFWAGLVNTGFAGRDSQTPGNVWLNCSTCGMTQYTPTTISGLGLGGTWMIRVSVEDQNCIPVELTGFTVGS